MAVTKFYYKNRAEWIDLRAEMSKNLKIGASDVGTALGLNKYKSPIQLFYNILGIYDSKFESLRMSLGLLEEAVNKQCYEAYSDDEQMFAVNVKDHVKANKIKTVNLIAVSSEFEIIAASLDFERPKNQPALVESTMFQPGEIIPFAYPIDAKNTNEQYYKKWPKKTGFPETYRCQLHAQMIATETKYSELSVKVDSSQYIIIPCPYDEAYGTWVKKGLLEFYKLLVGAYPTAQLLLEARANNDYDLEAFYTSVIASYEPPLIGSEDEVEFLNNFYGATTDTTIKGDGRHRLMAFEYADALVAENAAKAKKVEIKSHMVHELAGKQNILGDDFKIVHRVNMAGREYFQVKVTRPVDSDVEDEDEES